MSNFWEYDVNTDSWNQKGDLPAGSDYYPYLPGSGFVINGKMYLYMIDGTTAPQQLIKYEYSDETWTILSEPEDYEQYISRGTMGFSIDGYGYIRGDYELYRYDPLNNAWHTGDELPPGGRAYSITFEMDGKVYLGSSFNNKYDLWELDPAFE